MNMSEINIECLVHTLTFENYWAYFSQSGKELYRDKTKRAAYNFIWSLDRFLANNTGKYEFIRGRMGAGTKITEILDDLRNWVDSVTEYPLSVIIESRFELFHFLCCLKIELLTGIKLCLGPVMAINSAEIDYSEQYLRWRGHLPPGAMSGDLHQIVQNASSKQTIVVLGDIRRSQDLMTYALNPIDFSSRMNKFISTTRTLINSHNGFFDKFTGDGFLVYFNDEICKKANTNYIECCLGFIKEEMDFARTMFGDWEKSIRKLPDKKVGLTIGADIGIVNFNDINHHLVAVGDAIVWASRMASSGDAGQVILNNLLFTTLKEYEGLSFSEHKATTKAGESFLAHVLSFT